MGFTTSQGERSYLKISQYPIIFSSWARWLCEAESQLVCGFPFLNNHLFIAFLISFQIAVKDLKRTKNASQSCVYLWLVW